MIRNFDGSIDWLMAGIAAITVAILLGIGIYIYVDARAHDGQVCISSHVETGYVLAGKVLVPYTDNVCDHWITPQTEGN